MHSLNSHPIAAPIAPLASRQLLRATRRAANRVWRVLCRVGPAAVAVALLGVLGWRLGALASDRATADPPAAATEAPLPVMPPGMAPFDFHNWR
ncbi:MAG: hypothetical protein AzoDbin1_00915 [Azoarcus sp.]|nr:hypothetical protein [Azoarcus sp.]